MLLPLLRLLSARVPHAKQVKFSPRPLMLSGFYYCLDEQEPPALPLRFGVSCATVALLPFLCRSAGKAKMNYRSAVGLTVLKIAALLVE